MEYNTEEVFSRYKENQKLTHADIFHLYDTGEECYKNNSGYHDSRHFELIAFNSNTMQKRNLGRHDGIIHYGETPMLSSRIYADGSFFIRMKKPLEIHNFQCVELR